MRSRRRRAKVETVSSSISSLRFAKARRSSLRHRLRKALVEALHVGRATNDPVQRLDCFQKARAAQLECLQHVPLGMSAGPAVTEIPSGPAPPATSRPRTRFRKRSGISEFNPDRFWLQGRAHLLVEQRVVAL